MAHQSLLKYSSVRLLRSLVGVLVLLGLSTAAASATSVSSGDEPIAFNKCWDYDAMPDLSIALSGSTTAVYFVDNDRRLHAIDVTAATKLWSSDLGGQVVSDLLVTEASIVMVTNVGDVSSSAPLAAKLRSISRQTGVTNWIADLPATPSAWLGAVNGTIVSVGKLGNILAFSRETGLPVWNKSLGVELATEPHFEDRSVLVGTVGNELVRVSYAGKLVMIAKLGHLPTAVFSDSANRVMSGDERGNLIFMSPAGKRFWKFKNGAQISYIVTYDSEFLVASYDNFIYKISKSGNVEWKRRLSGRLFGKPLIVAGMAAASVAGDGSVYVLDVADGKIVNRIETGEGNSTRIAAVQGGKGLVTAGSAGLAYYSQIKCPTI
ncbi:MAG: PQQ-binding-like beta-propeller repeat protein [Blastocatellia bacterium]|nr:PQQ-binding-like beta-propeller repeat protein [Blastocatellia bacterium]